MKTLLLVTVVCVLTGISVYGQTSYSCYYREYCDWNEESQVFENCSGYNEPSLFVMNKGETMFTHTMESISSAYYVSKKEYDEENEVWVYNVTSDAGNTYVYVFDAKNSEVRAVLTVDGAMKLVRFYVKAIF